MSLMETESGNLTLLFGKDSPSVRIVTDSLGYFLTTRGVFSLSGYLSYGKEPKRREDGVRWALDALERWDPDSNRIRLLPGRENVSRYFDYEVRIDFKARRLVYSVPLDAEMDRGFWNEPLQIFDAKGFSVGNIGYSAFGSRTATVAASD